MEMKDYVQRRKALMKKIEANSIVIIPAASQLLRNGDTCFRFRQSSDFYYLTGFNEPDAILLLIPERSAGEFILFNQPRDLNHEKWDGPRYGQEGACNIFGADQSFPINDFASMLESFLLDKENIYYQLGVYHHYDKVLISTIKKMRSKIRSGLTPPLKIADLENNLHEMRLFKDKNEIAYIQKAVDVTIDAHLAAIQFCKPGLFEYQLEGEMQRIFYHHGMHSTAYPSIIGAGANTCVLHYIDNNQMINKNDLVLIDAGGEYQNYASDVTRTFPASGQFSKEQAAIYDIVLQAQLAALETIHPKISWDLAQQKIIKIITEGLKDLGILKGDVEDLIEQQAYLPFYMHRSGHWLGLDVHDVGRYRQDGKWRQLQAGMVLTVEPGIYISADENVPACFHNIGVRIEDDVLVTDKGHVVLSDKLPKTIGDIEAVMRA